MIKHMHFLLSCSKKHKGIYVMTLISLFSVFAMYLITVLIQNHNFHAGKLILNSGLNVGYFQEMVVYIMNGLAILYFTIFIYKTPKSEGYELIVFTRKSSRLNILFSRVMITIIYVLMLAIINTVLLSIPSQIDDILEKSDKLNWLLSKFTGLLIVCTLLMFAFTFIMIIFNYMTSLILGATVLLSFPLFSMMLYEISTPDTSEIDEYETRNLGVYQEGRLSAADVMPTVEGNRISYPNMHYKDTGIRILNTTETRPGRRGIFTIMKEYDKKVKYETFAKTDGWNAFNNYFGIFSSQKLKNNYRYHKYTLTSINKAIQAKRNATISFDDETIINVNSHYKGDGGVWNVFNNYTEDFRKKDQAYIHNVINETVKHLELDDNDARIYKSFSFVRQMNFWEFMINIFDNSKNSVHDIIVAVKNRTNPWIQTDSTGHKGPWANPLSGHYDNVEFGYYFAKMMIDKNEVRYKTPKFYDPNEMYDGGAGSGYVTKPWIVLSAPADKLKTWVVSDGEYDSTTPWTYIIPIIATLMFASSLVLFMRKDIK